MQLSLGFSPCPNDTFIFDAMVHGKVDTEGLAFVPQLEDVQTLNQWATLGQLDITKLSYAAFAHLTHSYSLLNAGSALGNQCGPLLISKHALSKNQLEQSRIAIPGFGTTAWFLYQFAFGKCGHPVPLLFSDIEAALLRGEVDAGVIIHENRFTYQAKGLKLIADLGAYWETTTGWPIPLGGIVVHNRLDQQLQQKVDRVMARSVAYAFANTPDVMPYVRAHAQEMDESVMQAHINLYVNQYTKDLGPHGRKAVAHMLGKAQALHPEIDLKENFFVN
jgi:1,4-dihydroxy-6-naphthoate synthase